MNNEFKKSKNGQYTVYTLESASSGGTSAGSVASVSMPMGGVRKRGDNLIAQEDNKTVATQKPRNFVAKNAKMGGAGQHKDKKKDQKQGNEKHKKPYMESLKGRIEELKSKLDEVSLGEHNVGEGAPTLVKGAAGLALGGLAAAGTPALMAILGPVLGIGVGAAGAYNASKMAMAGVDELWDWAAKKLGGEDNAEDFALAHINASLKGQPKFEYNGKTFDVKASPQQAKTASAEVSKLSETRRTTESAEDRTSYQVAKVLADKGIKYDSAHEADLVNAIGMVLVKELNMSPKQARHLISYDEDFVSDTLSELQWMEEQDSYYGLTSPNGDRDEYTESLMQKLAEKIPANAPTDVWVQDFQKADPNKYHQFKNKTPAKKAQMAVAASYAAKNPSKKK